MGEGDHAINTDEILFPRREYSGLLEQVHCRSDDLHDRVGSPSKDRNLLALFDPMEEGFRCFHRVEGTRERGVVLEQHSGGRSAERRLDLREDGLDRHCRVPAVESRNIRNLVFRANKLVDEVKARTIDVFVREEIIPRVLPQLLRRAHLLLCLEPSVVSRRRSGVVRDSKGDVLDHGVHGRVHS